MSSASDEAARVVEIDSRARRNSHEVRALALETLEGGGIVLLRDGFQLTRRERELVADASVTLPTRKERESRNGRPTVIFDPDRGKILHTRMRNPERRELEAMMARFGEWAETLVHELFPGYAAALVRDRVTFRPCERANPQALHVDASYGRPTEGRGMLRVFSNINPGDHVRVWQVGEGFEPFVRRFLPATKPKNVGLTDRLLARLGVTHGLRTNYDLLMEALRAQAKSDETYQSVAPRRVVEFPAGSAWIAITDLLLHGAISGQHSLDQTFFLPPTAMQRPERSSLRILEHLSGRALA